jgi:hypothetical protein
MKITDNRTKVTPNDDLWKQGEVRTIDGEPYIMAQVNGLEFIPISLLSANRWNIPIKSQERGLFISQIETESIEQGISAPLNVELIIHS